MTSTKLKDTLAKWQKDLSYTGSIHHKNIERFATLDVDAIEHKLHVEERGQERGEQDLPSADKRGLDEVEKEVVDLVLEDRSHNIDRFRQNEATYSDRFYRIDDLSEFSGFETDARDAISEFKKDIDDGLNRLEIVREQLAETADERRNFRTKNKLNRTAHYPNGGMLVLQWGIVILLFGVESITNGNFLAKGSDYGFIGGWIEAFAISLVNIGIAFLVGKLVVGQIWHRNFFRKIFGLIIVGVWIVATIAFNLLVAHYRETIGIITEIYGFVFTEFLNNPIGINDFESWMLFLIGLLFATITLIDVFKMDDAYPGYGKVDRKYEKLRIRYRLQRAESVDALTETKDNVVEDIKNGSSEVGKFASERKSILIHYHEERREFEKYLDHCNQVCNQLLEIYRNSNKNARKMPVPAHFRFIYELPKYNFSPSLLPSTEELRDLSSHQANLSKVIADFHNTFDSALEAFPNLADVTSPADNGKIT